MKEALKNLDVAVVQHPDDKATIEKLNRIPGFKAFIQQTVANIMEKYAAIEYSAEGINVTTQSMPNLYRQLTEATRILDMKEVPACSTDWFYGISSFSVGEVNKRLILQSGSVDLLTKEELYFLLGHELGHMKCGHKIYHMLTECFYMPIQDIPGSKVWMNLIKVPLLNWYRISDFTADRMGLLCCQDINVALSTMIKKSGLPKIYYDQIHIDSFIQQAIDFDKNCSGMVDNIIKTLSIRAAAMPWLVMRGSELLAWYNSGEYNRIINKYKQ